MKRILVTVMLVVMCLGILAGCGKDDSSEEQATGKDENIATEERTTERDTYTEELPETTYNMTREEVHETYFLPMEDLKAEYEEATDPDEIERIAQEYNTLAVEGRLAYMEATGDAPKISFIPRREYLLKSTYYRVANERAQEYEKIFMSYTFDEDDGNEFPSNMMVLTGNGNVSIDPEASDSLVYMIKTEKIDKNRNVTGFFIAKNGGTEVLEAAIKDYTDEEILELLVRGDYIIFRKRGGGHILYKNTGDRLELEAEYYDYDKFPGYPENGYTNYEICNTYEDIELSFSNASHKLRFQYKK